MATRPALANDCLGFNGLRSCPEWHLMCGERRVSVRIKGAPCGNDNEALLQAAREGMSILVGGDWLRVEDLDARKLIRVLPDCQLDAEAGIYPLRPSARLNTAALSGLLRRMEMAFKAGAPWHVRSS